MPDFILTIDSDEEVDVSDSEQLQDINPDFKFQIDGETTNTLEEFDFQENKVKEVDLDEIIKKKGGLKEESDDEELALDGFGMGSSKQEEQDEEEE